MADNDFYKKPDDEVLQIQGNSLTTIQEGARQATDSLRKYRAEQNSKTIGVEAETTRGRGPVSEHYNDLLNDLDRLFKAIAVLGADIEPILSHRDDEVQPTELERGPADSNLTSSMMMLREKVLTAINQLVQLSDRVEL